MKQQAFSIKSRIHSFSNAFRGLGLFFRQEHNARIHAVIAVITVVSGVLVGQSRIEWIAVFFAIGMVIATEAVNTTVEYLCDFICPEYNDKIKKIKDLAAGAVLICAIAAVIIGCIIFIPHLITLVNLSLS